MCISSFQYSFNTGFELQISDVGIDRSTNFDVNTVRFYTSFYLQKLGQSNYKQLIIEYFYQ